MRRRLNLGAIVYVLFIAGASLALTVLLHFPHGPEHWSADLRTAYLSERPQTQHPRIVLIYVSEKTLEPYPYLSPTDRQLLADVVRAVDAAGPKAIGLDFIIDRATEPAKDQALLDAVRGARAPVVLGAIDEASGAGAAKTFQAEFLEKAKRDVGHVYLDEHRNMLVISDNVVRMMARRSTDQPNQKSFAEILAGKDGPYAEPRSRYISWLLPPKDGTETFLAVAAEHVLERSAVRLPVKELLADKLVLIGGNFGDRDQHLTPLSVVSDSRYPGLFIHAQILAQLLANRSLATVPWPLQLPIMIVLAWVGYLIGRYIGQNYLIVELLSVTLMIAAGIAAFAYASLIFPYTGVLLAWLAGVAGGRYSRRVYP